MMKLIESASSKLFDPSKTFKPKKKVKEGTQRYKLQTFAKSLVRSGDLAKAVRLPEGAPPNHWLSVHTVDFYNIINVLYGSVTEFCTVEACPNMSSGPRFEYMWKDGKDYPKATRVPAPQYVNLLMTWIERQINDEAIFPSADDAVYPADFHTVVSNIFRRLFRVFAHVYYSHFDKVRELQEESHLNTAFKHFMLFVWEYDLINEQELEPLYDLLLNMLGDKAVEKMPHAVQAASAAAAGAA
jgi:MOB kinase activator 1